MLNIKILILGLMLVLMHNTLHACELSLNELDGIHFVMDHDMMTKSDAGSTLSDSFKVNTRGGACSFFITFSGYSDVRQLTNSTGQQIQYYLYDSVQSTNTLKGLPNVGEQNILSGSTGSKQSVNTFQYYFFVPYDIQAPAGLYTDSVQVNLYEGDLNSYVLRDSQMVALSVQVSAYLDLSMQTDVGTGDVGFVDFGVIEPKEQKEVVLNVLTNTPYDMSMVSENLGVLKHARTSLESEVPYTIALNGEVVDLSGTVLINYNSTKHRLTQDQHVMQITISDFDFVLSGDYHDNITVTVTAR